MMMQSRLVVRRQRDHQDSIATQIDRDSSDALQFRREVGPLRLARAAECDQRFLARLCLDASGEHARGSMTRACSGAAFVKHGHLDAALC
jgi:hypothetical protein